MFASKYPLLTVMLSGFLGSAGAVSGRGQEVQSTGSVANVNDPAIPSALAKAQEAVRQGQYDQAITLLEQLKTNHPETPGLSQELGMAYYRKGNYPESIAALERAVKEDPKNYEAVQLLGLSYYLGGRPADAIPLLERVKSWYSRVNVDGSYMLGMSYVEVHDYEQARKTFASMYEVPMDSAASYLLTARMLRRQEHQILAEEYAQKAISLDGKLPAAHLFLGELYLFRSMFLEAIAEFRKELALNPASADVYYKLADAYLHIENFEDAERLLQRSIWLDSRSSGPYILMGKVLASKGEAELAVHTLQHALSMDSNNPLPHYMLGQIYRNLGRKEDAEREFNAVRGLKASSGTNPTNPLK